MNQVEIAGLGVLKGLQVYAWALFLVSWAQMGWIDWREQKIRNRYLTLWFGLIAVGYAVLLGQSALGSFGVGSVFILRDYYVALATHVVVSVAAAYALWWLCVWPAGDVKLYCLLSLCYPLMRIPGSFHGGLLFLEVLINIFVPAAAFLFLMAGEYLWRTRLAIYQGHAQVRLRLALADARHALSAPRPARKPAYEVWAERAAAAAVAARGKAAELWRPIASDLAQTARLYRAEPRRLLIDAGSWFAMMAAMSLVSYYLNDVISSNILKTAFCFALMFGWSRLCQLVGTGWVLAAICAGGSLALWRYPHLNMSALAIIFGHITVFSLFIWLGVQVAMKLLAGQTGYAVLPLLMWLPGLIPWRLMFRGGWNLLAAGVGAALDRLPGLPALPRLPHLDLAASASFAAAYSQLALWAGMGLFFGLALVFVKIWDSESYRSVPIAHIEPFMTLAPSVVAQIEEDPDFVEEHFSTLYADGLTREQAEALKDWCRESGIETVALAPTISFANWIFIGYLLTRLLEGHVLRFVY